MRLKSSHLYYVLSFAVFFVLSLINTQLIPFMKTCGYSIEQQGILLAADAMIAICGQFIFGYLCDRYSTVKRFFIAGYIIYISASGAMLFFQKNMFFYHLIMIAVSGGMIKVLMGLNETWLLAVDRQHYGVLRAAGAIGMSIGSLLAGYLLTLFDFKQFLLIFLAVAGIVMTIILKSRDVKSQQTTSAKEDILHLLKNKQYLLIVSIFFMIYMAGTADQYTVISKLLSIGGTQQDVGWKWGIQSLAELPVLFMASWLVEKFTQRALLLFGVFMYALKFFLYGFFQTPILLIVCAGLQLVTMPIILLTSKYLICNTVDPETANSAQMFAMAIFVGGSALITPLMTAYLIQCFDYDMTLFIISVFCMVPFFMSYFGLKKT